jgi:type IV secretory pathway VirJ component
MKKQTFFTLVLLLGITPYVSQGSYSGYYGIMYQDSRNDIPGRVKNLPLVITASKIERNDAPVAFIISGDGGWKKFEQQIADKLALSGVPTIGLDIKKYFWTRKTPEETTADMAASINYYLGEWKRNRVVLSGYSLGAEIIPFVISRMTAEMRSRISLMVLLSPSATTDFEVHVSDMIGVESKHNTFRVIEEIKKIPSVPSLCIFGSDEKSKVPSMLKDTKVIIQIIPGDHHYNFDTALIVETIKKYGTF